MTFDDEFNALSASSSGASTTWMTQYPYGGENAYTLTPNDEQEYYSQATSGAGSPFSDTNGILNITATPATAGSNPYGLAYTSGLLTTYQSFSQTYGYFEVNAKLPAGQGLWPAFWMLPANNSCSSELDIFEMLGSDPSTIFGSTHGSWYNNGISQAFSVANTSTAFHTYGVDWEPDTITFYMDGTKLGSAPTPSTMNVPMYMLLNLAVGGSSSWGGAPSASTAFPATMSIDYVHAYATAATTFSTGSAAVNLPVSSTTAANLPTSGTTTAAGTTATGTPTVLGSGSDTLALMVNEDAYNGDAQFTVSVDGVQIGGTQTATASHSAGGTQEFDIKGTFAPGNHTASVNFLNDAYGGSSSTDRNLYVTGATVNGTSVASSSLSEYNGGTQSFGFQGGDTLTIGVSEDAYQGDAQYRVLVDGNYVGSTYTATASHAAGLINTQTISGSWGKGAHTVGIQFINDAYGGSSSMDRNLYVNSVSYDGAAAPMSGTTGQYANGVANIQLPATNMLTLALSEDAWQGDAQFSLSIDGKQVAINTSVTASHAAGATQIFDFNAELAAGTHDVALSFANDAYGGSSSADRNLYLSGASLNGTSLGAAAWTQGFYSNGTSHLSLSVPAS